MNYLLTERAARAIGRLLKMSGAVVAAKPGETRKARLAVSPGVTQSQRFHFGLTISDGEADESGAVTSVLVAVAGGAVQVGGYTYFVDGTGDGEELEVDVGTEAAPVEAYICARVNLTDGTGDFTQFASPTDLKTAQDDMEFYIFPLYKLVNGVKAMDYRPMPNAGCWEITPQ